MESNGKRIWVFDPANSTDHEAGGLRGRPITPPEWALNARPGWAEADGPAAARAVRRRLPVVLAVLVAVVVAVAGLAVWQTARVRDAVDACSSARDRALAAADALAGRVEGDEVARALAITADQVADPDTVTVLADAVEEARAGVDVPACSVSWFDMDPSSASDGAADAASLIAGRDDALTRAVEAVTASRGERLVADARKSLEGKVDDAAALLDESKGGVKDDSTRDDLSDALDRARDLLNESTATVDELDAAGKAIDEATGRVNDSVRAKQEEDARAAQQAAAQQAQSQSQQSYTPSYGQSYTPSYGGGSSYAPSTGQSYAPSQSYTPSYGGGSGSSGGSVSGGSGSSGSSSSGNLGWLDHINDGGSACTSDGRCPIG